MDAHEAEWISHTGRRRPNSPHTYVEVKFRNGQIERGSSAFLNWVWSSRDDIFDVMAWREVPKPPSKDEIIAALTTAIDHILAGHCFAESEARDALALARGETEQKK